MKLTGKSGRLMVGGREAAALADWTLEPREFGGNDIVASVLSRDDYWMEHGEGFALVLDIGARERTYKDITVHDNGTLMNIKTREA